MRRAAGAAVLVLVGALAVPILTATPVAADNPTLAQTGGPTSGPPGTPVSYQYSWDNGCTAPGAETIVLTWAATNEVIGEGTAALNGANCDGPVSGPIPSDASPGAGS